MTSDGSKPSEAPDAPSLLAVNHTRLHSGAERVLGRMLEAAVEAGWEVSLCAPAGPLTSAMAGAGVACVDIAELKPSGKGRLRALASLALDEVRAGSIIGRAAAQADVVVVNGLMALPAVARARPRAPVCWLVHDVPVRRSLRIVARLTARVVDAAIAPSEQAALFPRSRGISTTVSANGTPIPDTPAPIDPTSRVVGCNAAITSWKGQDVLLEAIADLPDVRLEIMGTPFPGDEPFAAHLRQRAEAPDLVGRVEFLGHVDDPLERMRSWAVCASPSVEPEAGSLVLLEAMSLGLPLVATDHGCAPEYLGATGVLVAPRDPAVLGSAIAELIGDPGLRSRLSAAARARAEAEYSLERSCERFLDTVRSLARDRVAP